MAGSSPVPSSDGSSGQVPQRLLGQIQWIQPCGAPTFYYSHEGRSFIGGVFVFDQWIGCFLCCHRNGIDMYQYELL